MNEENVSKFNPTPLIAGVLIIILIAAVAGLGWVALKGKTTSSSKTTTTASPNPEAVASLGGLVSEVNGATILESVAVRPELNKAPVIYTVKLATNTPIILVRAPLLGEDPAKAKSPIKISGVTKGQYINVVFNTAQATPPTTITSDLIKEIQIINPVIPSITPTPTPAK